MKSQEDLITEELKELPFYHGLIDSTKAVELLKHERPGTYLLRKSKSTRTSHKGAFTISVIKNRTAKKTDIYHFIVMGKPGYYYAMNDLAFSRIIDLLEYYKSHDYENHLDIPDIRLSYPLRSASYVSPYSYASVENRLDMLLIHLTQIDEETNQEICECGIPVKDSQLPNGWMIHQTQPTKPDENPYIFFQHNDLNLTQWDLPNGLWPLLTNRQRKLIKDWSAH